MTAAAREVVAMVAAPEEEVVPMVAAVQEVVAAEREEAAVAARVGAALLWGAGDKRSVWSLGAPPEPGAWGRAGGQ